MTPLEALKTTFGFSSFRGWQADVIDRVLAGKMTDRVRLLGHQKLSVFGIASEAADQQALKPVLEALLERQALAVTEHGGLCLGHAARPILRGEDQVMIAEPAPKRKGKSRTPKSNPAIPLSINARLFEALRRKRAEIASAQKVPAFVIFHDSTLRHMAAVEPSTLEQMSMISGIGAAKLAAYGAQFLNVIATKDDD